jgi:hypothetical protein
MCNQHIRIKMSSHLFKSIIYVKSRILPIRSVLNRSCVKYYVKSMWSREYDFVLLPTVTYCNVFIDWILHFYISYNIWGKFCDWILAGLFGCDCRCLLCLFILMLWWPVDSRHTPSIFTFLWAQIFSGCMLLVKYCIKTNLENVYFQGWVQGGGGTGCPYSWNHWLLHNYISHWLHFSSKFSFFVINNNHLSLNNVLDP